MIQIVKKIRVNHYDIDPDVIVAGTRGSYGVVKLVFDFDSSWDGLTKKIVFHPIRGRAIEFPLLDVPIDIPVEVMEHSGESGYVISGYAAGEEQALLSLPGTIKVLFTLNDEGGNSVGMTPDTYLLFLEQAVIYLNKILADAKASGEFKGEDGGKGDPFEYEDFTPEQLLGLRGPAGDPGVYVSFSKDDVPDENKNIWIIDDGDENDDDDILIPDGFVYKNNMLQLMCGDIPVGDAVEVISGSAEAGKDGVSPTVSLSSVDGGVEMTVTDVNGSQKVVIHNGKNFKILGYYTTLSALQNAVKSPDVGDAYGIGYTAPYNVYVWDNISKSWINNGSLAGVAGKDGADGKNGITFTPNISTDGVLSWTNDGGAQNPQPMSIIGPAGRDGADGKDGQNGRNGADGKNGQDGQKGADGVGILSVEQTTVSNESGGENVIVITLTNGQTYTVRIKNGSDGRDGIDGEDGSSASIIIDSEMSDASGNAVENKVIKKYVDDGFSGIKSVIVDTNLSSWASTMTFQNPNITSTSPVELLPGINITLAQLKMLQRANIVDDGKQTAGKASFKLLGTLPSGTIPVRFIIRKDM